MSDDSVYTGTRSETEELIIELKIHNIFPFHAICTESPGCIIEWKILSQEFEIRKTISNRTPFGHSNVLTRYALFDCAFGKTLPAKTGEDAVPWCNLPASHIFHEAGAFPLYGENRKNIV